MRRKTLIEMTRSKSCVSRLSSDKSCTVISQLARTPLIKCFSMSFVFLLCIVWCLLCLKIKSTACLILFLSGSASLPLLFSRFSDLKLDDDNGIPTQEFLDSCYAIVPVLGRPVVSSSCPLLKKRPLTSGFFSFHAIAAHSVLHAL